MLSEPEQCTVPAGIRKWSCFFAGNRQAYLSAGKGHAPIQIADLLHPLAAPWRGVEEGHHAERARDRVLQGLADGRAIGKLGHAGVVGIQDVVPPGDERALPAVADAPVNEERPLVLEICGQGAVRGPEIVGRVAPVSELPLPTGKIGIDQNVGLRHQACAASDDKNDAFFNACNLRAKPDQLRIVKKLRELQPAEKSENGIVPAEERRDQRIDSLRREHRSGRGESQHRPEPAFQLMEEGGFVHAGVALQDKNRFPGGRGFSIPATIFSKAGARPAAASAGIDDRLIRTEFRTKASLIVVPPTSAAAMVCLGCMAALLKVSG